MRNLNDIQKKNLAEHIAKKPIGYIELYNELYDHYASAYENGDGSFKETIEKLDDHFHYDKVKAINANLLKKTKKSVNGIYWSEFKNFWRWPQILTTLGVLLLAYFTIEFLPMDKIMWYIFVPSLLFFVGILLNSYILTKTKKYGNKRFKSAHLASTHHYLTFPITLFNLSIFMPALFLEPYQPRSEFYINYPVVPFVMMMFFFIAAYIGLKVFRSKIRVQYL